jgi:hypothetical protein
MQEHSLERHHGRSVAIDLCQPCQSFWFDGHESLALTPGATLTLFRIIGEHSARPHGPEEHAGRCPRCGGLLRRTRDLQRATRFEYFKCPNAHGRLITFFDFLKEKDFIRPLPPHQIAELRKNLQAVNCSNCGAAIDLEQGSACSHCGSPLSMLDMQQAEKLVEQLRNADKSGQPIDPALPLELARARREVDAAFIGVRDNSYLFDNAPGHDLVSAGLHAVARWLKGAS